MPATTTQAASAFRVCTGWSAYQDFATLPDALEFTATILRIPMADPLMRRVEVLDLNSPAPYAAIMSAERPAS